MPTGRKRTAFPKSHFQQLSRPRADAAKRAQRRAEWSSEDDRSEYARGRTPDYAIAEGQEITRESYELSRLLLGIDE